MMRYFVTGASGWIGAVVTAELRAAGHTVVGLARSDESVARLERLGAQPVRGDLDDPARLAAEAAASDGVVHLAFQHDVAFNGGFAAAAAADRRAVEAMGTALSGSDRPFVLASGLLGVAPGRVATEHDGLLPTPHLRDAPAGLRSATALLALSLRGVGVRSSVLRLPPTVHGDGDQGFIAGLVDVARRTGVAGFVDDGSARWPAVHVSDVGPLVRLALDGAPGGSVLHAVGDEGVPMREVAAVIGRQLGLPTTSVPAADAFAHFGFLGGFVGLDSPASGAITRELLGWEPVGPTLIQDLEAGHYVR